jgi:hypothetical protein
MPDFMPSPEDLATIRVLALAWLRARRHTREVEAAGPYRPTPRNPYQPKPEFEAALEARRDAFLRLKGMLRQSGASSPLGWPDRTTTTLRTLWLICRGGWDAPSPDDFPDLEADVEALGTDLPPARGSRGATGRRAGEGRGREAYKRERCIAIYADALAKGEAPPTAAEVCEMVGCSKGTFYRAIKPETDRARAEAQRRHREKGGPERSRSSRRKSSRDK